MAPPGPLHFLGGRITAAYSLGAVFHGDGLNVGVTVREDRDVAVTVLFDPDQGLSERIITEQFTA